MEALVIAGAVRMGNRRAVDVVTGALERADKASHLGAFTHLQREQALQRAAAIDTAVARGEDPGRLAGVPIAIKDNIAQAGEPLGCASKMLHGYIAPRTATALKRLEDEGAVVIGRTNMDEFGMGSSGENSAVGPTLNPNNTDCVPGGSSSGSAAAVAAGVVPIALGSDTGGSVRQPASFCGVIGLKPTYGRISRSGLVAFGSSLDQIGPITRSVRDAAVVTRIMSGIDLLDSSTIEDDMAMLPDDRTGSVDGMVIGLPRQCWEQQAEQNVMNTVRSAIGRLEDRGATVVDVDIPILAASIPTYYLLTSAEAASNLSRFDGIRFGPRAESDDLFETYVRTRSEGLGAEVQRRILLGTFALAEGYSDELYVRANAVRSKMRKDLDEALAHVDALAMPTTPTTAFRFGEKTADPLQMYLSDIYTTPPSLTGHPAVSLPAGDVDGLPVGLQLIGRTGDEAGILKLGMSLVGR
jgi:aspartyl-tRNA(Asn)/glutamyl-tRNA(Gln) amidotransferase subunit A